MSGAFSSMFGGGGGGGGGWVNQPPQAAPVTPPTPAPIVLPEAPAAPEPVAAPPRKEVGDESSRAIRKGQSSTLLTGGLGDTSELKTSKRRLLGG